MPFEIIRNDITNMQVDAIVNSANPRPMVGLGTDSMIHEKAGPQLLEARKKIGNIRPGSAAITDGYQLRSKYVIHTVGPVWRGGIFGEGKILRACYENSLRLALEHGCESIAFPLISTNNYGFPKDKALQIAIAVFSEFLTEHEMHIYLLVFNRSAYKLSEKLFQNVACYIDENYVESVEKALYGADPEVRRRNMYRRMDAELRSTALREESAAYVQPPIPPCPATPLEMPCMSETAASRPRAEAKRASAKGLSLADMLRQADAGFTETLLKRIDESGRKDSEIYKKALLSKQHFSKIRNNPHYKPTKPTAIALALALELDLEQTRDLIGRAGYALTNSSKFDLIIRYFIEQRNYNVVEINCVLFDYDQSLLGS